MRCVSLILMLLFLAGPVFAIDDKEIDRQLKNYRPELEYPGEFALDKLYRLRPVTGVIDKNNAPAAIKDVTCREARNALINTGEWLGNLNRNGSCASPGDPHHWVTGNYLNYIVLVDSRAARARP